MPTQTDFARNLKTWLAWMGLQQGDLARICRVSSSMLSRSLRYAEPQPWLLARISQAVGLPSSLLTSSKTDGDLLVSPDFGTPRDSSLLLGDWITLAGASFAAAYLPPNTDTYWARLEPGIWEEASNLQAKEPIEAEGPTYMVRASNPGDLVAGKRADGTIGFVSQLSDDFSELFVPHPSE